MFETIAAGFLCLAMNVYHEAKNQPFDGQVAVAQVVLNRVEDERYPNSICEVVEQGPVYESWKTRNDPAKDAIYWPVKNRCQFSWYCDGKSDIPYNERAWENSVTLSKSIIGSNSFLPDITDGSLYYHGDYVEPSWSKVFKKTLQIDTHIFYR